MSLTVGELIEKLRGVDSHLPVVIRGYEGGHEEVRGVHEIAAVLINRDNIYGPLQEVDWADDDDVREYGKYRDTERTCLEIL